jgi:hypothetical protein
MKTPQEEKHIPIGWWRFSWPSDMNARLDAIEQAQPTLLDVFANILTVQELARFIRAQNNEYLTEEHFALLIETVLGDCKKGQTLSRSDWMELYDAARHLITDVVRRNYRKKQKLPRYSISDDGIRLKECRCYSSLFQSMIPMNRELGDSVLGNVMAEYSDDARLLNILKAVKTESRN